MHQAHTLRSVGLAIECVEPLEKRFVSLEDHKEEADPQQPL